MCESNLLVSEEGFAPINLQPRPYTLNYYDSKTRQTLLEGLCLSGVINKAEAREFTNAYGFKHGYLIIIGEKLT